MKTLTLAAGTIALLSGAAQAALPSPSPAPALTTGQREAPLEHARLDEGFRVRLLLAPHEAARELGIELPAAMSAPPRGLEVAMPPFPWVVAVPPLSESAEADATSDLDVDAPDVSRQSLAPQARVQLAAPAPRPVSPPAEPAQQEAKPPARP